MIITVRNEYRVEASLTENELSGYGITYDKLDYSEIETRRVLWTLFDDIKRKSGVEMALSGKVLIEVMKESVGSYRVCFTSLSSQRDEKSVKQLIKSENQPVAAEFSDFENLLASVGFLTDLYESSLYEKNGEYILFLRIPSERKSLVLCKLAEFSLCRENAQVLEAQCDESGLCIIKENAVGILRDSFSVR